jgi:hypothetical protein
MPLVFEGFDAAPAFTAVLSTFAVSGGRLRPSATATDTEGYSNTDMGSDDHHVEGLLITTADTTDVYHSLVARWNGLATQSTGTGYIMQQNFDGLQVYCFNAGSFTNLATIASVFATPGAYKMRLEVAGNQISAKINDAHVAGSPFTNSTVTTGTKAGITMNSATAVSDSEWEWWEAGTPAAPSDAPPPTWSYRSAVPRR